MLVPVLGKHTYGYATNPCVPYFLPTKEILFLSVSSWAPSSCSSSIIVLTKAFHFKRPVNSTVYFYCYTMTVFNLSFEVFRAIIKSARSFFVLAFSDFLSSFIIEISISTCYILSSISSFFPTKSTSIAWVTYLWMACKPLFIF